MHHRDTIDEIEAAFSSAVGVADGGKPLKGDDLGFCLPMGRFPAPSPSMVAAVGAAHRLSKARHAVSVAVAAVRAARRVARQHADTGGVPAAPFHALYWAVANAYGDTYTARERTMHSAYVPDSMIHAGERWQQDVEARLRALGTTLKTVAPWEGVEFTARVAVLSRLCNGPDQSDLYAPKFRRVALCVLADKVDDAPGQLILPASSLVAPASSVAASSVAAMLAVAGPLSERTGEARQCVEAFLSEWPGATDRSDIARPGDRQ